MLLLYFLYLLYGPEINAMFMMMTMTMISVCAQLKVDYAMVRCMHSVKIENDEEIPVRGISSA